MPKRNARNPRPKKRSQTQNQNNRVADLERRLARLSTIPRQPQSNVSPAGKLLLSGANTVASFFGMPTIFGSGSYSMNQNSMWDSAAQVPVMHSASEKVVFRHREFISDIYANGNAFTQTTLSINPGLPETFPYLSTVANAFQEYSFKGLVFEYRSTSATALVSGTNTALGTVALCAQYRTDSPLFVSKSQLLNEMWAVDCKPSENVLLPIECDPRENYTKIQYVRSTDVPAGSDVKTFDLARLVVATSGFPTGSTNIVGELWASYEVELYKPSTSFGGSEVPTLNFTFSGVTNALPLGTARVYQVDSFPPMPASWTLGYAGSNNIYFPLSAVGFYLITYTVSGATPQVTVSPAFTFSTGNCIPIVQSNNFGDNTSRNFLIQVVQIIPNGSIATIGINGAGTLPGALIGGAVVVTQLSDNVPAGLTYRV